MYDYNIYKWSVYVFHVRCNIKRCALQEKLRPTRTRWFEQRPVGGSKSDCLKARCQCSKCSLLLLLSSISNSRKDDPEAGPLDSRLNTGWDKLSRRIKDFVKAITSQDQHQTAPCSNTASPVTSRNSSGDSQSNTWNRTKDRRNTWKHTWKRNKATACLTNIKASIINRVSISNWTGKSIWTQ